MSDAPATDAADPRYAIRALLDAGERLVARFGTRDPLEFADLAMAYTKAHNRVERLLPAMAAPAR